jgi:hypothetical protein
MKVVQQPLTKININNKRLNAILEKYPRAQHAEEYKSALGKILCLYEGNKKTMYFKDAWLGDITQIEDLGNEIYLLTDVDGYKRFFCSRVSKELSFDRYEDLGNGIYLLTHSDGDKCFFHPKDEKESGWFSSYEDLGNGIYLLIFKNGYKRFFRPKDMEQSNGFSSYKELKNGYCLLTYSNGDQLSILLETVKNSATFSFFKEYDGPPVIPFF